MSISRIQGGILTPLVRNKEEMLSLIKAYRLIPFFSCPIPGYSIEEHTPPEFWFTETNWPDFTPEEFETLIERYQSRDRRFGGRK